MKRLLALLIFQTICVGKTAACPLCVGKIEHGSPPFFSQDFDRHNNIVHTESDASKHQDAQETTKHDPQTCCDMVEG